jgi:hypothetical protein
MLTNRFGHRKAPVLGRMAHRPRGHGASAESLHATIRPCAGGAVTDGQKRRIPALRRRGKQKERNVFWRSIMRSTEASSVGAG